MYIDTRSKEGMESSMSTYLDISVDELYQYIDYAAGRAHKDQWAFNTDIFRDELENIISDLRPEEQIDEFLLFHLSRRLHGTENDVAGRNLENLLTTRNALSDFLRKYQIEFVKGEQNIITYYNGQEVDWDKCWDGNSSYMKVRLGYFKGREDYCFNGFAFRDLLYKNSYARALSGVPEIIGQLIERLGCKKMGYDFMENSTYYCYEYKVPIERVMFDGHDTYSRSQKQRYIVHCVLERLLQYSGEKDTRYMSDHDNPILRLNDHDILPAEFFIQKELVTADMLR